ncbi:acyl-CoA dehydrogenase family protein [Aquipuribacter sp. SD81]|uniref:acyl-CoA dehydrogenase family protein n=1 Tax=Aquipuribacter sp. SD81 TaxID=3127703 RepID=UPI003018FBAB
MPPEPRTRRDLRPGTEHVIDLRAAAASRGRGDGGPPVVSRPDDTDLVAADPALVETVARLGGEQLLPALHELGRHAGARATQDVASEVEATRPRLESVDLAGERVDRVVHHPAWRPLLRDGARAGLTGRPLAAAEASGHLRRAAALQVWAQVSGSAAMSASTHHAAVAAVAGTAAAGTWLPRLAGRPADGSTRRAGAVPTVVAGLALSERGGSDPAGRAEADAVPRLGGPVEGGPTWRVSGRKWFVGNADADVLVVRAVTEDGPALFLVPRRLPDGSPNGARMLRLRPGSARTAWPVGDAELHESWAVRLEQHDPSALERTQALDAAALAAGVVRGALWRAVHHCRRSVRGAGPLDTLPLVRTVLADVALESEAATTSQLALAAALDAGEEPFLRLAAPVLAAHLSRRAPQVTTEAAELLGPAAWDGTAPVARLQREATAVLSGATAHGLAVHVVDVLAAPWAGEAVDALDGVYERARGASPRLDAALTAGADLLRQAAAEARQDRGAVAGAARWLVERLAVTLQAALLAQGAPTPVADAFLASRLDGAGGLGTTPLGRRQTEVLLARAVADA